MFYADRNSIAVLFLDTVILSQSTKWLFIGHRPSRCTAGQLERAGVEFAKADRLRCQWCRAEWPLGRTQGGRMAPRYWHCPSGCNKRGAT